MFADETFLRVVTWQPFQAVRASGSRHALLEKDVFFKTNLLFQKLFH